MLFFELYYINLEHLNTLFIPSSLSFKENKFYFATFFLNEFLKIFKLNFLNLKSIFNQRNREIFNFPTYKNYTLNDCSCNFKKNSI